MKIAFSLIVAAMFVAGLTGCRASGEIGDTAASISAPR